GRTVGADRCFELLRTRGRRGHQPVWLQFRCRARDRRRSPCRGPRHAVGRLDREPQQGLVRTRCRLSHVRDRQGTRRMTVTIYHNPDCGTSRSTLAMLRQSGEEPEVFEYLKEPPSRERLMALIAAMGMTPRDLWR